jgi:TRAP-type uncharacterized transport system fused permease subunit
MKDVIFGVQNPSEQGMHFSFMVLVFALVRVLVGGKEQQLRLARRGLSASSLETTSVYTTEFVFGSTTALSVHTFQYFWDYHYVA